VHRQREMLGRFADVADRPGLPRAFARTILELRMAEVSPSRLADADLARILAAYEEELHQAKLADRADVLRIARERVDASELVPLVACPHTVDNVKPVEAVEGTKVHQVVIGSCTNGRLEDISAAARILKGRHVAPGTRLLVFPASARVFRQAVERGYVGQLMRAGAVLMNSGCGCCLGIHEGALGDAEVALSTTNRNFRGRMGNPNSEVYLCSPEVAAASAITGFISDPRHVA